MVGGSVGGGTEKAPPLGLHGTDDAGTAASSLEARHTHDGCGAQPSHVDKVDGNKNDAFTGTQARAHVAWPAVCLDLSPFKKKNYSTLVRRPRKGSVEMDADR